MGHRVVDGIVRDLRYGLRTLVRTPVQTVLGTIALGMGIAAVTTVFSYIDARLLRPAPYAHADRLVSVSELRGPVGPFSAVSLRTTQALRQSVPAFSHVGAYTNLPLLVRIDAHAYSVQVTSVDSVVLPTLGVRPIRGRLPTSQEVRENAPVALISNNLWTVDLRNLRSVIGDSVRILDRWYSIIGVMPQGFRFQDKTDVWTPLVEDWSSAGHPGPYRYGVVARIAQGSSKAQAALELATLSKTLAKIDPGYYRGITLRLRDDVVERYSATFKPVLALLGFAATLVLLIACANTGNLLLMRAAERKGEWAVRAALGASRAVLIRQSFIESSLLGLIGAILGTYLSVVAADAAWNSFGLSSMPAWFHLGFDARVLVFVVGAVVVAVVVVGISPVLFGTRVDIRSELTGGGVTNGAVPLHRHGRRAIVAQVALGVSLTVWALLLRSTIHDLAAVNPGYARDKLVAVALGASGPGGESVPLSGDERRRLATSLKDLPGVAGVAYWAHFRQFLGADSSVAIPDYTIHSDAGRTSADLWPQPQIRVVSDHYFATTGIEHVAGRRFLSTDTVGSQLVAEVSERLANALWGTESPINRHLRVSSLGPPIMVVGVVGDVRNPTAGANGIALLAEPDLYLPARQAAGATDIWLVRAGGMPAQLVQAIPDAVGRAVPSAAAVIARGPSISQDELVWALHIFGGSLTVFAGMAASLALLGIYAVFAFSVIQRRREVGIRLALGGSASSVWSSIMIEGIRLTGVGMLLGTLVAVVVAEEMRAVLWGVSPLSAWIYASVYGAFAFVAVVALAIPAYRACRTDPAAVLRRE